MRRVRGDSIIKSPGSREASKLEGLADRPRAECDTIINFADGTRMSVASIAEPKIRIHFPPAKSHANHRFLSDGARMVEPRVRKFGIPDSVLIPAPLNTTALARLLIRR